jgi:hypothetical protein
MLKKIPEPGFSPREVEIILSLSLKRGYQLVREHQIDAYKSVDGSIKITRDEVIRYQRKQKRIEEAKES